jgi:hypothetical protein
MEDPNATMFSKVVHGLHVGTAALGLIPNPVTLGISFAGDMTAMGLQAAGLLNDRTPKKAA